MLSIWFKCFYNKKDNNAGLFGRKMEKNICCYLILCVLQTLIIQMLMHNYTLAGQSSLYTRTFLKYFENAKRYEEILHYTYRDQ